MTTVDDIYRLSPMQAGMLFHCVSADSGPVYFEQYLSEFEGDLDVRALKQAWADVIAAHPALRTAFVWEGLQEPMQAVYRDVALPWTDVDWTWGTAVAPRTFERLLRRDRSRPFVLSQPPLIRFVMVRLGPRRHVLLWSLHHLLIDGWSCTLVRREVAERYRMRRGGLRYAAGQAAANLPPAPFADYVRWIDRQDRGAAERFWREHLRGAVRTPWRLEPPRDEGRRGQVRDGDRFARVEHLVAADVTERIQRKAREHEVTLATVCRAAWALVLSRYAESDDVLFGMAVSGRPPELPDVERMVGMFVNTVPARVKAPRRARVADWLKQVQAQALDAQGYEFAALVDVQQWSALPAPLFDSLLVYENFPGGEYRLPTAGHGALQIRPLAAFSRTNYPLSVIVRSGTQLQIAILGDRQAVHVDVLPRVASHLAAAMESLMANARGDLSGISLLTAAEREEVVRTWNRSDAPWRDHERLLPDVLARQAALTPDAVAVVIDRAAISYATLHERADRLAHVLRAEGVGLDVCVAVCLEPGIELMVALLAVWKAGGAYVPLDPNAPRERAIYILQDVKTRVLIGDASRVHSLAVGSVRLLSLDRALPAAASSPPLPRPLPRADVVPESLAYVIYTSGTTGRPKGVAVTHGNVASLFAACDARFDLTTADTWMLYHSVAFDVSVFEMWGALRQGARLVVVPHVTARVPEALYGLVCRERVTIMNQTPSAFRPFVAVDADRRVSLALQIVISGGEPLDAASLGDWVARHGLTQPVLINVYGPTETTVFMTHLAVTAGDVMSGSAAGSRIGRALPGSQAYVLDERGEPMPVGVPGEICIGGALLARGYVGRADLTAERFVPDPFSPTPGARLYRSEDRGRWHGDGMLAFEGRLDHQVKLRGYRIELGEIEAVLRQQPGVRDAAVLLREDVPGDPRLVAYLAMSEGANVVSDLPDRLRAHLPDYMAPAMIVRMAALPLTVNGKIDRRRLPAPDGARDAHPLKTYLAPRDAIELALVRIWEHLLAAHPIGVRDTFTGLGGHSILMLRMVAQIERRLGVRLRLDDAAAATTIERLATCVRQRHTAPASRLVALQPEGRGVPLVAIVPAGGTLACYVALAGHMGHAHPFYACQPRASLDDQRTASTIEEIAREDVQELRRIQPSGPYALVGWSMGGLVAYEMARQLHEAGDDLCLLALLDVGVPDHTQPAQDEIEAAVELMAHRLRLPLTALENVHGADRLEALFTIAQARGRLADEIDLRWTRWLVDGFRTAAHATRLYRPRPYPGHLLLIRSAAGAASSTDPSAGWNALARGGVEVRIVAGTHNSIVEPPHVVEVADVLRAALDRAELLSLPAVGERTRKGIHAG